MIEHHCAHIQVLYMNGAVKHFLLLIGDVSKVGKKRGERESMKGFDFLLEIYKKIILYLYFYSGRSQ